MNTVKLSVITLILVGFCTSCAAQVGGPRGAGGEAAPAGATAVTAAADPNPIDPALAKKLTREWTNELKSTLIITSIDLQTGAITGSYRSPSGGGATLFPLVGWVNTVPAQPTDPCGRTNHVAVVSFSVRWGKIGSVTTWNGYYLEKDDVVVAQWLLSRPNSQFVWDHVLVGQDRFMPAK